jgi:polysaccharide pyruvyl transferase CsaB
MLSALARLGHDVTAYVNCRDRVEYDRVRYIPLDEASDVSCDVFVAITTGGDLSFAPLRSLAITAALRVVWVQGVPRPADLEAAGADRIYVASNFLRDVCVERWGVAPWRLFVCYNGLDQEAFARAEAAASARDRFSLAYIGPPEKGLDASIEVLRRLRSHDQRYHLDVFGGAQLWGRAQEPLSAAPGIEFRGMLGQAALIPELFKYEYCIALQAMEEGFGIAVQEAKRAGQIVFASGVGALPELIIPERDGFVIDEPHMSAEAHDRIAGCILQLERDPRRRERLRRNALATPWSWTLAARTWTAHWDHLIEGRAVRDAEIATDRMLDLPDGQHSELTGRYIPAPSLQQRREADAFGLPTASGDLGTLTSRTPGSGLAPDSNRAPATARLLIGGYYGHGNLGDEAILGSMLEEFRQALPDGSVTVVSADPDATRRDYSVDAVHERDLLGLFAAAEKSDLIVLGGGGLFQDYWGLDEATLFTRLHWGLTYCAAFPALATVMRRPFMLYAVGVGPLLSEVARRYTRLVFERANAASVRDHQSWDLLGSIGVDTSRVEVTADPAFLGRAAPLDRAEAVLARAGVPADAPCMVALALRQWDIGIASDAWQRHLATALDRFVEMHRARVLFVPFHTAREEGAAADLEAACAVRSLMRNAAAAHITDAGLGASLTQAVLARADLVVAMRLHGAVLAANAHVPTVALAYDPKVQSLMDQLGMSGLSLDLASATSDRIWERMEAAYRDRHDLKPRLSAAASDCQAAARRNMALAIDLLGTARPQPRTSSPEWDALLHDTLLYQTRRAELNETRADRLTAQVDGLSQALHHAEQVAAERQQGASEPPAMPVAPLDAPSAAAIDAPSPDPSHPAPSARPALERLLAERTAELVALASELGAAHRALASKPGDARRRFWRTARTEIRAAGHGLARRAATVLSPVAWVARGLARALVPSPARQRLRQALVQDLMTPRAFVFDCYKRARTASYGPDAAHVRVPCDGGLVSIVLPVYNGAALIRESIDSVLDQTYSHLELIVVDDGSTDGTGQIADEYAAKDGRVRVVHQENRRLPAALSRGFRLARGEFLTWTSADNRLKPFFLDRMVDCLRRHPAWDMTYANLDIIGEDGLPLTHTSYYGPNQRPPGSAHVHLPDTTSELNVWANNSIGGAFLYRARVAHLLGDYSSFRFVMEDYDYWMRVNALLTLRHTDFDEPVYDYRFHSRSLTARWEELDMLGNRERLMVFDDFRRDFYLVPMLWVIEPRPPSSLGAALERRLLEAGHLVYAGAYPLKDLPRLGMPVVYAGVSGRDAPDHAPRLPEGLPESALKLLLTDAHTLPTDVHDGWDLCAAVGAPGRLPRLSKEYQGWLGADDIDSLFQAVDVRAKSAHLERIEALVEAPAHPTVKASVIICTRRASDRLMQALRSVAAQNTTHSYEIVLVNNNPLAARLEDLVERLRAELLPGCPDRLRTLACPVAGLSAARNAGLMEAGGEIVCFLDDDAVAARDWIERLCGAFDAHPSAGVVGGHIALKIPDPRPSVLRPGWTKYWSEYLTEREDFTEVQDWRHFPWGASWAARRRALLQVGGFRTGYGRTGDNFWGGEELVASCLIQRLGYTIAVEPRAAVIHDVDPSRFTLGHVRRTIQAGGRVGQRAERDRYLPAPTGLMGAIRHLATHHFDRTMPRGRARWIDAAFRKAAQAGVLLAELNDLRQRARKPVVADRS